MRRPEHEGREKVVVTLPGAVLPGDFRIEPRKTYGHISNGMCASERELGLGDSHDGIILLREYGFTPAEYEALKPGDDAMHLLHLDQPLLEINITPASRLCALVPRRGPRIPPFHRRRLRRSVSALDGKTPLAEGLEPGTPTDIEVSIEDDNPIHGVPGCDRYYAAPSAASTRPPRRRTGCAAA